MCVGSMGTLSTLALISLICGIVLAGTAFFIFHLAPILCLIIGVVSIAGLFIIGLILSTMT